MKAVIINGWGQVYDSISGVLPPEFDNVSHINYAAFSSWKELIKTLPKNQDVDLLIGWSLGGQIAIRLVENGMIRPKLLVLLATPFQFVADEKVPYGMNHFMFQAFRVSFQMIPGDTLKRFAIMIAEADSNMKKIIKELGIDRHDEYKWLEWLEDIGSFSCFNVNFDGFPRTLIIHGENDAIVDSRQAALLAGVIPLSHLEILPQCGHAPHLHDTEGLRAMIRRELQAL